MRLALLSSRLPALALIAAYGAAAAPLAAQSTSQSTGSSGGSSSGQVPGQAAAEAPGPVSAPGSSSSTRTTTYGEASISGGYSSNPSLQATTRSSTFVRASLMGFRGWNGDRGRTTLTGYVENTTYLRGGYGSKQIFRLNARTDQALSEKVRVFGALAASGDISGQLENRFTGPPGEPPPVINPDVINLTGRQYLVSGQVGTSITTSPKDSLSLSGGATHAFFTGGNKTLDYTTYQTSLGYGHQLSELTSLGLNVGLQRQDYTGSDHSDAVNLAGTFGTKLAPDISANGSVGILAIYIHRAGISDHSYSPSFSGSICKFGERTQYCASVSRTAAAPLAIRGASNIPRSAAVTTNFSLSYSRVVGEKQTLRAQLTGTDSSSVRLANEGKFRTTYVTGLVSYDRKIATRLFAGVSVGARKLFQTGPDPKMDYNGNFYLRYRLGDLL